MTSRFTYKILHTCKLSHWIAAHFLQFFNMKFCAILFFKKSNVKFIVTNNGHYFSNWINWEGGNFGWILVEGKKIFIRVVRKQGIPFGHVFRLHYLKRGVVFSAQCTNGKNLKFNVHFFSWEYRSLFFFLFHKCFLFPSKLLATNFENFLFVPCAKTATVNLCKCLWIKNLTPSNTICTCMYVCVCMRVYVYVWCYVLYKSHVIV